MSVTIQIRDLDEGVRDRLKARAALEGDSLNTYLKRLLTREVERPSQAEVFERVRRRSERSAISSIDLVRADREARSNLPDHSCPR
ncbi:MAG: hypothetical protein GX344_00745 [Intrasporangiaceae bacterium]|nr:hypothetical protein [Intrasporangiaceae bacterium]